MNAATKIQTRNGRTLSFDGESYVMTGPTGTHSISASESCFERLAAHWSGFCEKAISADALKTVVVKAFLVRSDCEIQTVENEWTGKVETESTCFDFGVDILAGADITATFDECGNVIGYSVSVEWNGSGAAPRGIYSSDFFTCDGWEVMARTARAAAAAHLVEHILDTIAIDKITLDQIVGATA